MPDDNYDYLGELDNLIMLYASMRLFAISEGKMTGETKERATQLLAQIVNHGAKVKAQAQARAN